MTFEEALVYIDSLKATGIRPGLAAMSDASLTIGNPERAFDTVHIAGTNGKGSTAAMITAALTANGYRVGTYTSPAVTELRDTVLINGAPVDKATFAAQATRLHDAGITELSEFEWITMLAFCCFEAENVDIAVIECGLGGNEDATNIVPPPACAVLTPIDLDHAAFLGHTVEAVASQKSGIIKERCHVVCAAGMSEDALGVIFERAAKTGATVHIPSVSSAGNAVVTANETRFIYQNTPFSLSLCGKHQIDNALTALCVLECLGKQGYPTQIEVIAKAFADVHMPCRQEWIDRSVLLDGAHNPHGIQALVNTLQQLSAPVTLVIGMLKDKDIDRALQMLSPFCRQIICCTPDNPRAATADELCTIASRYHGNVIGISDPVEAFRQAKKSTDTIVVGGSFYTAGVVRHYLLSSQS